MLENVKKVLAEQLEIDESRITPESKIKDDLGADSLDVLQLLMAIEDEMGISVPDEALAGFVTVQDVVNYLESIKK